MFAYSFLAMTGYNVVKPITRSTFIAGLGADNLPWVQLAAGALIGAVMHGYVKAIGLVPRRWAIPVTQAGLILILVALWALLTAGIDVASVALYVLGLMLGILLISQFWTLANDVYDARHAKRLFGFIGAGASLGGVMGNAITLALVSRVGTVNLLLAGAAVMLACLFLVIGIVRREAHAGSSGLTVESEGVGGVEALRLLRDSRHLQLIALIIGCAAMGGAIIEQQVNMAGESVLGRDADRLTEFLAQVGIYLSIAGFVIQVSLTSRVHRLLGMGFALLVLPIGLGTTALVMLVNAGLWAPAVARILDTSLRYTVDKTTREILFLPLPTSMKHRAKAFVDVTVDRVAKALGALVALVLIKVLGFDWQQLSYASLTLVALWIVMALSAKREYLATFRRSLAQHDLEVTEIRVPHTDLQSIELLVEELGHADERRVLYAIDLLESLDKPQYITPLLLHHDSPRVRARTLAAIAAFTPEVAAKWVPAVERLLADEDPDVRAEAVRAIGAIRGLDAAALMRAHLTDADPRVAVTAAATLAASQAGSELELAAATLERLAAGPPSARIEVARALGDIGPERFHSLLVPLIGDGHLGVARAAIRSAARVSARPFLVVPALVALLRHRLLKNEARAALVSYGEAVVEPLAHFLKDQEEDLWVRRHLPGTLAQVPCQRTLDVLVDALSDPDGFLRFKAIAAIADVQAARPSLTLRRPPVEALALEESRRYFEALTLHANLTSGEGFGRDTLLVCALEEKQARSRERLFRLLGLLYAPDDMRAAWHVLNHGDARQRADAAEYLDNALSGKLRSRVLLMVEDMPLEERVHRTNVLFRTRRRTPEDTLAQLIHDEDPVIAASAVHLAAEREVWELEGDIEYVLAHRDARDWYVFEAASWVLAGRRMTAERRRARWLEPIPTVELAARLRRVPLFNYVSVDELFRFAGAAKQVRYDRGRSLFEPGSPGAVHVLIDGEVRFDDGAAVKAPGPLAFEEIFVGASFSSSVRAVDVAVTLALTQDEFLMLLSDNIDIAHGLFRTLLEARGAAARPVVRGLFDAGVARRTERLQPMERALLLQGGALLSGAARTHVLQLADITREVPLEVGAVLSREGERAVYLVLSGALTVETRDGARLVAGPGDAVGLLEALTDRRLEATITVSDVGAALRLDQRDLFDLLADHAELLQALVGGILRQLPPAQ